MISHLKCTCVRHRQLDSISSAIAIGTLSDVQITVSPRPRGCPRCCPPSTGSRPVPPPGSGCGSKVVDPAGEALGWQVDLVLVIVRIRPDRDLLVARPAVADDHRLILRGIVLAMVRARRTPFAFVSSSHPFGMAATPQEVCTKPDDPLRRSRLIPA